MKSLKSVTVLFSLFLILTTCVKDEIYELPKRVELSEIEEQERTIVGKMEGFMPDEIIDLFKDYLTDMRQENDYSEFLDSIEYALNDLIDEIEANFTMEEFHSAFDNVIENFESLKKSSLPSCFGLGYAKGAEVNIGASGNLGAGIVAGLQAAGGGGIQYVYDFVNFDRQIYCYTFCSYGWSYGVGVAAAISGNVGFTGIYQLITGIQYHSNISGVNKFEGPSLGKSHTLSGSLAKVFNLDLSVTIGSSSAAYADFSGILNLSPCPYTLVLLENGPKSYSFSVSGSIGVGPAIEILLAYSNNQVGSNSYGIEGSYKKFSNNKILAGLRMSKDLIIGEPEKGIITLRTPFDLAASAVAIYYSFKDFSNCPDGFPIIGTFPANSITSNSAICGGVITNDGGSEVNARGLVWSKSENPTIHNNEGITADGSGIGEYISNLTGLEPNTTYFVRAYGTNGVGTSYGEQEAFKTLDDDRIYVILEWGETPEDLDAHLTGPIPGSQDRFHVFWAEPQYMHNNIFYAALDNDINTSYGPETITIYQETAGKYRYSVHDNTNRISNSSYALSNSSANVKVFKGTILLETFYVPSNRIGTLWTVFEMEDGVINPINTMTNVFYAGDITK